MTSIKQMRELGAFLGCSRRIKAIEFPVNPEMEKKTLVPIGVAPCLFVPQ